MILELRADTGGARDGRATAGEQASKERAQAGSWSLGRREVSTGDQLTMRTGFLMVWDDFRFVGTPMTEELLAPNMY